jgi:uracil-DNA glycosylase
MGWTERQAAMLKEMGLRVEVRPESTPAPDPAPDPASEAPHRAVKWNSEAAAPEAVAKSTSAAPVLLARVSGIDSMAWPALREAVAGCTACKLCQGRTNTVFGTGNVRSHWMVVGEAPGEQEDAQGEPFVGKSGQLLDNMLRAIGLSRDASGDDPARQVYIANSVKCRPPGNRNPAPDELAQCEPFLIRQVALVQPKIILAMGRFAVQSLLRSQEPIGRLRGRVHRYQGVPLIVTYHPAYLLRNLEEKAKSWDDLCLALETVNAEHP